MNNIENDELIRLAGILKQFNAAAEKLALKDPSLSRTLQAAATPEDVKTLNDLVAAAFKDMTNLDMTASAEDVDLRFARHMMPLAEHTAALMTKAGLSHIFAGALPPEAKNTKTAQSFDKAGVPSIAGMIITCLR